MALVSVQRYRGLGMKRSSSSVQGFFWVVQVETHHCGELETLVLNLVQTIYFF